MVNQDKMFVLKVSAYSLYKNNTILYRLHLYFFLNALDKIFKIVCFVFLF